MYPIRCDVPENPIHRGRRIEAMDDSRSGQNACIVSAIMIPAAPLIFLKKIVNRCRCARTDARHDGHQVLRDGRFSVEIATS